MLARSGLVGRKPPGPIFATPAHVFHRRETCTICEMLPICLGSSLSAQLLIFLSPGVLVFGSQNWVGSAPPSSIKETTHFPSYAPGGCANVFEGVEIEQAIEVAIVRLRSSRRLIFLDLLTYPPPFWLSALLRHDMRCAVQNAKTCSSSVAFASS